MKPEQYVQKQLRLAHAEAVDLTDERVLLWVRLHNLAAHWDNIIRGEMREYGIAKTADQYGLEVSTVRSLRGRT